MAEGNTDNQKRVGVVKWFSHRKGFGFLTTVDNPDKVEDVFAHYSAINTEDNVYKNLYEGEYIEFSTVEDDKGQTTAQNITGIKGGNLLCQNTTKKFLLVSKNNDNDLDGFKKVKGGRGGNRQGGKGKGRGYGKGKGSGGRYQAERTNTDEQAPETTNKFSALNDDSS